jgi:hypothetical protein
MGSQQDASGKSGIRLQIAAQMIANYSGCDKLGLYEGIVGRVFYMD